MSATLVENMINTFTQFISNLLPTFKRSRVLTDILKTREELLQLQPIYKEAAIIFSNWKYKSEEVKSKNEVFKSKVGGRDSDNPIVHMSRSIPTMLDNLDQVGKLAEEYLSDTVVSSSLTYKQTVLLRYIDGAFLVAKYMRMYVLLVTTYESAQYKETSIDPNESFVEADRKWMTKVTTDFCNAYLALTGESGKTVQKIREIPDIEVGKSSANLVMSTQSTRVDPLNLRFIATNANPAYFFKMMMAEWEHKRHLANKNEVALLELRLLQMQKLQKGQPDARLEQQIKYLENRIQKLHAEIEEVERQYG